MPLKVNGNATGFRAHLFTLRRGVLPVRVFTLYCKACKTTYRSNYCVTQAEAKTSIRQYYREIPSAIEASEYCYVDRSLLPLIRAQMAFAQYVSASVARIYNRGISNCPERASLASENIWNAFYIHALMLDVERRQVPLQLPHHGPQTDRFRDVMAARNIRMAGTGQPQWAHTCDECERIVRPADPSQPAIRINACVMDGVTIGHPRCNVDRCVARLASPRDRFCEEHSDQERQCAIRGCNNATTDGMRTCSIAAHRSFENERRERGKALFRLRRRHERTMEAGQRNAEAVSKKPRQNPRKARAETLNNLTKKAAISRRWTHNEQLMVRTCGVVISRATFYEAESMSNCVRFLVSTFPPHLPRAHPSFCFFDSACLLLKHILANNETRLDNIGLVVDVFHAINKHKDSDAFCQLNCNPATFPELFNEKNEWWYNSSACEQTNGWFGFFLPVVREMGEVNYNFFLDEMILIHNEWKVDVLRARGARPRIVPMSELALPR
ncbi:hypothetical protein OH76DRAFT_1353662 [Lentinus brumalis]|uniref:CxC6 like cysteine cluster associated with KDZ domain-containing protein n=1 Tax=Lentinus brumalis TaxID=2498619 RepID=A0A371D5H6_9APHY|nr:hypothetical protein OH76DRAFT_1353662 [Polyporus brumalis]